MNDQRSERPTPDLPTPDVVAQIQNAHELVARFERWPSFSDAEVMSLNFERGNHCEIVESRAWSDRIAESVTAIFHVFDESEGFDSPRRRPTVVTLSAIRSLHALLSTISQ